MRIDSRKVLRTDDAFLRVAGSLAELASGLVLQCRDDGEDLARVLSRHLEEHLHEACSEFCVDFEADQIAEGHRTRSGSCMPGHNCTWLKLVWLVFVVNRFPELDVKVAGHIAVGFYWFKKAGFSQQTPPAAVDRHRLPERRAQPADEERVPLLQNRHLLPPAPPQHGVGPIFKSKGPDPLRCPVLSLRDEATQRNPKPLEASDQMKDIMSFLLRRFRIQSQEPIVVIQDQRPQEAEPPNDIVGRSEQIHDADKQPEALGLRNLRKPMET